MAESSPNWLETLWEKEGIASCEQFLLSHSVFKRLVQQTRKYQGLFGKGLIAFLWISVIFVTVNGYLV